jgi:hypothetical protein
MKNPTMNVLVLGLALGTHLICGCFKVHAEGNEFAVEQPGKTFQGRSGATFHLLNSEGGEGRSRRATLEVFDADRNLLFHLVGRGVGNDRLLEPEIMEIWDEGGLVSVLVRHDVTDIPQQAVPTPGARGLVYEYDWYIFDSRGGETARKAGFETRELPGPAGKYVCLLRERVFRDDHIRYQEDPKARLLWEVKLKSQFEIVGTRKSIEREAEMVTQSWTWEIFSKNGRVLRRLNDFDFYANRYFHREQMVGFLERLPKDLENGRLTPNEIWVMMDELGGIQETNAFITRFSRDKQTTAALQQLFADAKKSVDEKRAALQAALPELQSANAERMKKEEEARRQRVKEMDAKADKLDRELYEQAKRKNEQRQKEQEEEMAE